MEHRLFHPKLFDLNLNRNQPKMVVRIDVFRNKIRAFQNKTRHFYPLNDLDESHT
jgi:hypothetical protein